MLRLRILKKPLRVHLQTLEIFKMWNFGAVIKFPCKIRHKFVELFGPRTNLIVVYETRPLNQLLGLSLYVRLFENECEVLLNHVVDYL